MALLAAASLAPAADKSPADKSLAEKTGDSLKHAGDKTVDAGRSLVNGTKKATGAVVDAITPGKDAKKVDVMLSDNHIGMDKSLAAGKTEFVVRNSGKEKHGFEIRGAGLDKKFMINLSPGEEKSMSLDLKPGSYEVFCPEKENTMKLGLNVH